MVADKWALEKAQALQDLEEEFNQQTAKILTCYQLPKHLRLDLHEQHRNDYMVPDDLRLKFVNAVFEGNPRMLDHEEKLKAQARKEADKFWTEAAGAANKAQALQDMKEWYMQLLVNHAFDIEGIPERIKEAYIREIKLDDEELMFKNHVEKKFGICNHETRLRVRAWEESQQFRIKTMADYWAAKKLHALQDLEKAHIQRFMNILDKIDIPDYVQQAYFQKYKVPDDLRLRYINHVEIKFRRMPDDEEEPPKGYISEDYNKLKAQALQDLDVMTYLSTSGWVSQEQHCNDYKVPDNLRVKFITAVFKGNSRILDHKGELKVQARKEAEKFWIEEAATEKKTQALQDMEERFKQQFIKLGYARKGIPEHIQEYYLTDCKLHEDTLLKFRNDVEEKFGMRNHEMQLKIRAWEKTQQFRIEMMADKRAAKKTKALQDMEERYIQDFMNIVDKLDVPEYFQQAYFQKFKVPDDIRLRYINDIEEEFRMLGDKEGYKVHIWDSFKKLKSLITCHLLCGRAQLKTRILEKNLISNKKKQ
uniref:Uncharacterized protein n=1 Tax=Oryza nivara TaxID=4536 RepID=A0A0E0INF9_ORYNI